VAQTQHFVGQTSCRGARGIARTPHTQRLLRKTPHTDTTSPITLPMQSCAWGSSRSHSSLLISHSVVMPGRCLAHTSMLFRVCGHVVSAMTGSWPAGTSPPHQSTAATRTTDILVSWTLPSTRPLMLLTKPHTQPPRVQQSPEPRPHLHKRLSKLDSCTTGTATDREGCGNKWLEKQRQ